MRISKTAGRQALRTLQRLAEKDATTDAILIDAGEATWRALIEMGWQTPRRMLFTRRGSNYAKPEVYAALAMVATLAGLVDRKGRPLE